jgi:Mn2+/Fe2+ NRAMP family transporter
MLAAYPLMIAMQEISARIGRVTGKGIAGNIARHYPNWLVQNTVLLIFVANIINIGADLAAMGDAVKLLIGGPATLYLFVLALFCVLAQVFVQHARYVRVLKWLTLVLFVYVVALATVRVPWVKALHGIFVPSIVWSGNFLTTLVAIAGTTISPYLFFWQAAEEAEHVRVKSQRAPLVRARWQAPAAFARIRADTFLGMAVSNVIAIAIMIVTAATLHSQGTADVASSAQAAAALKPVAGQFAALLFAIGIIGTGLLGVPVLAGSAAYALGEARGWPVGLARAPREASAFYTSLAVATMIGVALDLTPIDPIKALYWSAVVNGVTAVPIMAILMLMASHPRVMGEFVVTGWLRGLGWLATAIMAACVVGMAATLLPALG